MNVSQPAEQLANATRALLDRVCAEVIAGEGLGTTVILNIGKVVGMERLGTPRRRRDFPIYEASIFIQDATWRLEDGCSVVCSSGADDNSNESPLVLGLRRLVGQKITDVELRNAAHDLIVRFENGLSLLVFSTPISSDTDAENYSISTPDHVFALGFDGAIYVSPHAKRTEMKVVSEKDSKKD